MFNPELGTPEGYEDMEANLLEHRAQEVDALTDAKLQRMLDSGQSITESLWPCSERFSAAFAGLLNSVAHEMPDEVIAKSAITLMNFMSKDLCAAAREEAEEAVPPVTHEQILDALEMSDSDSHRDEWEGDKNEG